MKPKVVLANKEDIVYNHIKVKGNPMSDGTCKCKFENAQATTNTKSEAKSDTKDQIPNSNGCSGISASKINTTMPVNTKCKNKIDSGETIDAEKVNIMNDQPKFTQKPKLKKEKNKIPDSKDKKSKDKTNKRSPKRFDKNLPSVSECTESNDQTVDDHDYINSEAQSEKPSKQTKDDMCDSSMSESGRCK